MFYDVHHDKYDYSKVVYKGMLHKILIVCPIHGDFYQTPSKHISGQGCPLCRGEKISKTKRKKLSVFVNEANKERLAGFTNQFKKGDVVLIAQPNIPDCLVTFYAVNKIGAIANMVHPFTPYNQILQIYKKTNSKMD